ncbi:MAG: PilW family protein [Polaromonas sp.]
MKTGKIFQPRQCQGGMTLIEVLVALTIGLVILIAIGTSYLNSANLARQRENQSELNEPATLVMRMLQHDLSLAGYVDIFDLDIAGQPQASSLFNPGDTKLMNLYQRVPEATTLEAPLTQFFPGLLPVFGCDGGMGSTPNAIMLAGTTVPGCGVANATQQSLQMAFQAAPSVSVIPNPIKSLLPPDTATGEGTDCNQQAIVPAGAKIVINRYFVRASPADGINELYCSGSGNNAPQPLARGVEEFVLRYQTAQPGVAAALGNTAPAAGGAQSQYVNATAVAASALGWANVSAVEVCMVSATATTSGSAATGTAALQPLRPTCRRDNNGNFIADVARAAGDNRLWKRFTSVTTLRNAIYSTPN